VQVESTRKESGDDSAGLALRTPLGRGTDRMGGSRSSSTTGESYRRHERLVNETRADHNVCEGGIDPA